MAQVTDPDAPSLLIDAPPAPSTLPIEVIARPKSRPAPSRFVRMVRQEPVLAALMVAGVAVRALFWAVTDRKFEDGLTSVTHAHNVVLGLGLTHHPGEGHVQGFTSALSVLVPLLGELVHPGWGLDTIRLASLLSVCVALFYADRIARSLGVGGVARFFLLAYLAFDQNQIFYGMAGMETEMAVAILLAGVYHVRRLEAVPAGICLGLALLVRPDFLLWMAPAFAFLVLRDRRAAARAAAVSAGLVAPWLVFTTLYYGSPIPNTIVAKSLRYANPPIFDHGAIGPWVTWLGGQVSGHLVLLWHYLTPFKEVGFMVTAPISEQGMIAISIVVAGLAATGAWRARQLPGFWPISAFLVLYLAYRIYFLPPVAYYEWYLPPFMALVMLLVALGIEEVRRSRRSVGAGLAVLLAFLFALHIPSSFAVDAKVQAVEDSVRVPMALWLRDNVKPGDSVTSESAGYVGYYSGVKLYDYPGLTSPAAVRAMKSLPPDQRAITNFVAAVQPDWVVLRPWEEQAFFAQEPEAASHYDIVQVFQVPDPPPGNALDQPGAVLISAFGLTYGNLDEKFLVLHRVR